MTAVQAPAPTQTVPLALPYDNADQQREAAVFGMWIFLATEVLFFGGLFVAYIVYRYEYPAAFKAGSAHLSIMSGAVMTAVLLLGSLLVAISDVLIRRRVHDSDPRKAIVRNLAITTFLGVVFLSLEFYEWGQLIHEGFFPGPQFNLARFAESGAGGRSPEMFFCLFFFMTGLHAFHMIIGIALVGGVTIALHRTDNIARHANLLENIGLYWHFVDIIWVFLFPLFYLVEA